MSIDYSSSQEEAICYVFRLKELGLAKGVMGQHDCENAQYCKEEAVPAPTPLTRIAKALSHPLRERMLRLLADGERCGCEFAPDLNVDPSIVSRSFSLLEQAGLVSSRRDGVRVMWSLRDPRILVALGQLVELTDTGRDVS